MARKYIFSFVFVSALLLTGSGCAKSDTALVVDFINSWMQSRGILDANGKPTAGTIRYVASGGWVSSGDKTNDAIIDGGQVVKSMKDADEKANTARDALEKNPPDQAAALQLLTQAVDSRPNDWYLRNQKGILLLDMGRGSEAQQYLTSANGSCDSNKNPNMSDAQRRGCMAQLQSEADFIAQTNNRAQARGDAPDCAVLRQQSAVYTQLAGLGADQYRAMAQTAANADCE